MLGYTVLYLRRTGIPCHYGALILFLFLASYTTVPMEMKEECAYTTGISGIDWITFTRKVSLIILIGCC